MIAGEIIKFYREFKGYNQSEFARLSGIPLPTLKKYEKSDILPKAEPLKKIADTLGISPNTFLEAEYDTIGDLSALFFLLARSSNLEIHGEKTDGKYSPNDISFSFSHPLLQEFMADWASTTESVREMRKKAEEFKEEELKKTMLDSAEALERTLEYNKVSCKIKL